MILESLQIETKRRTRSLRLKEAVLASFREPRSAVFARLLEFTARDWQRAAYWLDVSGLALYFLDRLVSLDATSCVPCSIIRQLEQKMTDNRGRTAALFDDALAITQSLAREGVECALLKGVTLPAESVPDCALRLQMDLDLMIRRPDAELAERILITFGYSLDVVSGNTWEFKAGPSGQYGIKHLYQARLERALDVHVVPDDSNSDSNRLRRARRLSIRGEQLPALCVVDAFIYQAKHLYKHICSDHLRASWVLEFWRHVCTRCDDTEFWRQVKLAADQEPGAKTAIGSAILLASHVFGPFAPEELCSWSMDLPPAIGIWIQLYWRRVLLSDTPRHKLYLLLRRELSSNSHAEERVRRRLLLPLQWPQRITRPLESDTFTDCLRRYWTQARFSFHRLCFHLVEGIGFGMELRRWHRRLAEASQ